LKNIGVTVSTKNIKKAIKSMNKADWTIDSGEQEEQLSMNDLCVAYKVQKNQENGLFYSGAGQWSPSIGLARLFNSHQAARRALAHHGELVFLSVSLSFNGLSHGQQPAFIGNQIPKGIAELMEQSLNKEIPSENIPSIKKPSRI